MSHGVMPFDMSKTVHIFQMTESGGIQRVVAKDPIEADQVTLIRQHLQHEAERFSAVTTRIPQCSMDNSCRASQISKTADPTSKMSYSPLPAGAEITFETKDLHLLTAIHRWFGAQLSEHGADARAE